jgi:hypothetical protein
MQPKEGNITGIRGLMLHDARADANWFSAVCAQALFHTTELIEDPTYCVDDAATRVRVQPCPPALDDYCPEDSFDCGHARGSGKRACEDVSGKSKRACEQGEFHMRISDLQRQALAAGPYAQFASCAYLRISTTWRRYGNQVNVRLVARGDLYTECEPVALYLRAVCGAAPIGSVSRSRADKCELYGGQHYNIHPGSGAESLHGWVISIDSLLAVYPLIGDTVILNFGGARPSNSAPFSRLWFWPTSLISESKLKRIPASAIHTMPPDYLASMGGQFELSLA